MFSVVPKGVATCWTDVDANDDHMTCSTSNSFSDDDAPTPTYSILMDPPLIARSPRSPPSGGVNSSLTIAAIDMLQTNTNEVGQCFGLVEVGFLFPRVQ